LVNNHHPFLDGNKRTDLSAAALFLEINGWRLAARTDELVEFTLQVALTHPGILSLAEWFRKHSSYIKG